MKGPLQKSALTDYVSRLDEWGLDNVQMCARQGEAPGEEEEEVQEEEEESLFKANAVN